MKVTAKKVTACLKEIFWPKLEKAGFSICKDGRSAILVDGDLLKVVAIQLGRSAGSIYLHYFVNFLGDPFVDIMDANIVGARISGGSLGEDWYAENVDDLGWIVKSMSDELDSCVLPELERMSRKDIFSETLKERQGSKRFPLSMALNMAVERRFDEARNVLEAIICEIEEDEDFDIKCDASDRQLIENVRSLIQAIDAQDLNSVVNAWREENLRYVEIHCSE